VEHGAEHLPAISELIYPAINFILFTTLLVRALSGPIREYFRERAQRLREELAAGDRARRDAEALRAQLARELADLPATRERLKADLFATAERERDQVLAMAKQNAERIRTTLACFADQEVAAARAAARRGRGARWPRRQARPRSTQRRPEALRRQFVRGAGRWRPASGAATRRQ
jgi:F0F1-type ATP synthase membrane subunit b/b'